MQARHLSQHIEWVGALDWKRRLFDEFMPLTDGTTYNAYLIKGQQKTALIDTVEPHFTEILLERLAASGLTHLDYLISNHAEQDHSGAIPEILAHFKDVQLIATPKAKDLLSDLLQIDKERIRTVADQETLDLGGATLRFIHFPWVHWPETMLTWYEEARCLFPCDLFGAHYTPGVTDLILDKTSLANQQARALDALERYYACILMPYRPVIARNFGKITPLNPQMIAPSHGPIYRGDLVPEVLQNYRTWISEEAENLVTIIYASMHESTESSVEYLAEALLDRNIQVQILHAADEDVTKLALNFNRAKTLIFASPNVNTNLHPAVSNAAILANLLKPKVKFIGLIGSYSWGSKFLEHCSNLTPNIKAEILNPVLIKGPPALDEDRRALTELAQAIAEKHQQASN